jgi:microcystin degradation protein MlrC
MRIAVASILHESNTFSKVRTKLQDFHIALGDEMRLLYQDIAHRADTLGGFLSAVQTEDTEVVYTVFAQAHSSGKVTNDTFGFLKDKLIEGIKKAGPVDGVFLALHGSMVTDRLEDPDGNILEEVRRMVGRGVYIISVLDSHANVSKTMVENADVLIGYKTAPHVDAREIGQEAAKMMNFIIKQKVHHVMAIKKIPMLLPGEKADTNVEPMVSLLERAREMENGKGVLSVSIFISFAWSDVEANGPSVVAITENDPLLAERIVADLAEQMWRVRDRFHIDLMTLNSCIDEALATEGRPVIISDVGDNPSGGASGDVTFVLEGLLEKRVKNAAMAILVDPRAVEQAVAAGVGNEVTLELGGKIDTEHSKPVKVKGKVRSISDGEFRPGSGRNAHMRRVVVFRMGSGIDVVLTERVMPVSDPQVFRKVGIEPAERKIIVLKDGLHFRAHYGPIARKIIFADTPGWTSPNMSLFRFDRIKRPVFPLDQNVDFR